jgi:hypothetical protein
MLVLVGQKLSRKATQDTNSATGPCGLHIIFHQIVRQRIVRIAGCILPDKLSIPKGLFRPLIGGIVEKPGFGPAALTNQARRQSCSARALAKS